MSAGTVNFDSYSTGAGSNLDPERQYIESFFISEESPFLGVEEDIYSSNENNLNLQELQDKESLQENNEWKAANLNLELCEETIEPKLDRVSVPAEKRVRKRKVSQAGFNPTIWQRAVAIVERSVTKSNKQPADRSLAEKEFTVYGRPRKKKSQAVVQLTFQGIQEQFGVSLAQASKNLGISATALKKYCRQFGIGAWPYREAIAEAKRDAKGQCSIPGSS